MDKVLPMNEDLIDRSSPIPAYQQVATSLTARIAQEEWRGGGNTPPGECSG